jgi:sporulation protein YlmC with PRC-barrel domain
MHSHMRSGFIIATAVASLMSSAAFAQTPAPKIVATEPAATATTLTPTTWMTQEVAGQWRTSKMVGLNVYNNNNEKIGDISELIVDRTGKLEAAVIGVGGFLGLGQRDVAVPYAQIGWAYRPVVSSNTSTGSAPITTGAGSTAVRSDDPRSYPDHATLNMTKEQLAAAPAFKFSR